VTSAGIIVGALGEEFEVLTGGEPKVGYIDEASSVTAFVDLFDVDDFKAATASGSGDEITGELPPETVGIDPNSGEVYIFGHDNFELLSFAGIAAVNPSDPEILGWDDAATLPGNRVDLHGLEVDGNGTVYGFDEAGEALVIWDGNDVANDVTAAFTFASLKSTLGGTGDLEPTLWRGIKARATSATESEVFISPNTADQGLVRVEIVAGASNVSEWMSFQ